ncbi:Sapep family Mn(2+)-dependent dipeptidase [Ruminococcus flavefaciens]|uniref:Succinyl-diaminopimelate desuccinylase n=1 Tax=Ruminococcus flavefaciens TaxID=1265 RepID=A0A1M7G3J7_RUMFL|nr:Sapep family Mn(2+)-dependent dipeptidase [Ruminococcus flavefaciens]SHM10853.1 succinyl-diaminopimelate desuccinylase [Ruminococcus flavefaciens]
MTEIRKYLEEHKQEMIDLLAELVAIPSIQGKAEEGAPFGKEPARALEVMLKKCEEAGFKVDNVENYAGSADINDAPAQLAVLTHLDVVPVGTGWTTDPFVLRYEADTDKLVGRGAIDDKGPAVAAFFAARALKDLSIPLKKGVRLIFGTNEENGSADLAYYRKKRELPPMVFTPDGEYPVINAEKGMLRVYFSSDFDDDEILEVQAGTVINAVPQFCTVTMENDEGEPVEAVYEGASAHASTPEKGENAITQFLESYCGENMLITSLAQLFPHGETNGKSCGLGFRDDLSGDMTCVLSMLNTDMGRISGGIDIRFPLDRKKAEISEIICGALENAGFTVDSCEGVEPHCTDENSEFVKGLLRVYERVTGDKGRCIAIGGGTYVHEIEGGVAFGAEFPNEDGRMHSPDEFITSANLLRNAEIMAEAMAELCC